jgi:hypothetical protein
MARKLCRDEGPPKMRTDRLTMKRLLCLGGVVGLAMVGPMVGSAVVAAQAASAPLPAVSMIVPAEEDGSGEAPPPTEPDPAPEQPAPAPEQPASEPEQPDPAADEPVEPEPAPADEPLDADEPATKPTKKPAKDAAEEDAADEAALDEQAQDEAALDEEALDQEALDQEALDQELLDGELLDGELLDGELLDGELLEEEIPGEEIVEEEIVEEEVLVDGAALGLEIFEQDGVRVSANGSGLLPGSRAELWVLSTPRLLATGTADDAGAIAISAALPADLPDGSHTVLLRGTDIDGLPVELGNGIEIGPGGELLAVTPDVDVSGLQVPTIPDDPKAPQYPTVAPLDEPEAVVSTTIAALALLSVTGVAAAMGAGAGRMAGGASPGVEGGGINEGMGAGGSLLDELDVEHNRGWRRRFTPKGRAPGDTSRLYRGPLTSYVDEASYLGMATIGSKSPLLARMIGDGAPIRAITGSFSLLLPILAMVLGVWSAILGNGIAEPPVLGFLLAIMIIGVVDGLAGGLGALAFAVTVIAMGGVLDWSSVRTLMGVALLMAGPGLIASSFRDIRRAAPRSFSAWWERGADLIIVPLLGAYTTYNVALAMPPLGGSLFPVAESAVLLAWVVAAMLVVKVGLEEAAARWFPERMATVTGPIEYPGSTQQVLSSLIRLGLFLFVSAAFIGSPWQLWVGAVVWILPMILYIFSARLPNAPRLWQVLPDSMPALGFGLLIYLILAGILASVFGDETEFALMSFVILLVPGLILGLLALVGREPREDDVKWYLRPNMTGLYRVGGVVVLVITCWLAYRSLF